MRWKNRRKSQNVEDRRGQSVSGGGGGGMGMLGGSGGSILMRFLPMLLAKGRKKWLVVAVVGLFLAHQMGIDVPALLLGGGAPQITKSVPYKATAEEESLAEFTSVVLADTEETWTALFKQAGQTYPLPKLVLFSGAVKSACGLSKSAMGPFYCPGDQKIYIDLSFYNDLKNRHGAPGDFAQAYVIAHEVGHHLQTVLGISSKVHQQKLQSTKEQANQLSVRQELQADCLAGVWGYHAKNTKNLLEEGDIDEAFTAAAAIGDDRLQKQARGYVTPESFTHGTSDQRKRWFKRGLESGQMDVCDTFKVANL